MSLLEQKCLELIHAEADGEASAEDMSALRDYLASHPEAQAARAELSRLTNVLSQVEKLEAPADLRKNIMGALPQRRSVAQIGLWMNRSRFGTPLVRYGYALAAGVLLGAVLTGIALKNLSPLERSDVYGTIASPKDTERYIVTEQNKLDAPDLGGTVEVSRSGDRERIVFDINSSQPTQVEVSFDGGLAGIKGFTQEPSSIRALEAKEGSIFFRSEGKQNSIIILASQKGAQLPVNLRFYVAGKLVKEVKVGLAGSPK